MNATKQRFKTRDATLEALERLEATGADDSTKLKAEVSRLTAELAAKNAEIKTLATAGSSQQSAPAPTQPLTTKPISQMSSEELIAAFDSAAAAGNHAESNRFFRQYE